MAYDELIFDVILLVIRRAPFFFGFLGAAPLLWIAASAVLHAFSTARHTVLNEVPALGTSRPGGKIHGTAVVAGGGGAGVLAARVLSDHFEEVVVVEPEDLDTERDANWDTGYAQPIALPILRRLFPALEAALLRTGLRIGTFDPSLSVSDRAIRAPDYLLPPTIHGSQAGLERFVLDLTRKGFPNVKIIRGRITGLTADSTSTRVASATFSTNRGTCLQIPVALFVDATGSAATGLGWLASAAPTWQVAREAYDPSVIIASTLVPVTEGVAGLVGEDARVISQAVREGRHYSITKLEDGRLRLTASQRGGSPSTLPNSITSFLTWCTTIHGPSSRSPDSATTTTLLKVVQDASTADIPWTTSRSDGGAYIVRYDVAPDALPANFVALGSALVRQNALYAAATSAELQVAVLDGVLRSTKLSPNGTLPDSFAHVTARAVANRMRPAWLLAKTIDYSFEQTQPVDGESRESDAWLRWYCQELLGLVSEDDSAAACMWNVLGGTAPLSSALHPALVARVIWRALRSGAVDRTSIHTN